MIRQNIGKTINYMKRNGVRKAVGTVYERLTARYDADYFYEAPKAEELERQRNTVFEKMPLISIIVPAYETREVFFSALIASMAAHSYRNWDLILADASQKGQVKACGEIKQAFL